MTDCDETRAARVLGSVPNARAVAHLVTCERCRADTALVERLRRVLAADTPPTPSPALTARVVAAAAPSLHEHARRATLRALVRVIAVALLPLPALVLLDAYVLRTIYTLLSTVLPEALSFYLVANYAALLALLFGLAYGAIPLLAAQQLRLQREGFHG